MGWKPKVKVSNPVTTVKKVTSAAKNPAAAVKKAVATVKGVQKPKPAVAPAAAPVTSSFGNAYSAVGAGGSAQDALKGAFGTGKVDMNTFVQTMPEWESIRGPGGQVLSPYAVDPMQSDAFKKMHDLAMSEGKTNLYKENMGLINTQANNAANSLALDTQNAYESGVSNLAQAGGVDAGNMERLNRQQILGKAAGNANIYASAGEAGGRAAIADTELKTNLLGTVGSGQINANQFNASNAIADARGGNLYDLDAWSTLGDIWGSGQVADAMGKGLGGGGGGMPGLGGYSPPGGGPLKGGGFLGGAYTPPKNFDAWKPGDWLQPMSVSTPNVGGGGGGFSVPSKYKISY